MIARPAAARQAKASRARTTATKPRAERRRQQGDAEHEAAEAADHPRPLHHFAEPARPVEDEVDRPRLPLQRFDRFLGPGQRVERVAGGDRVEEHPDDRPAERQQREPERARSSRARPASRAPAEDRRTAPTSVDRSGSATSRVRGESARRRPARPRTPATASRRSRIPRPRVAAGRPGPAGRGPASPAAACAPPHIGRRGRGRCRGGRRRRAGRWRGTAPG